MTKQNRYKIYSDTNPKSSMKSVTITALYMKIKLIKRRLKTFKAKVHMSVWKLSCVCGLELAGFLHQGSFDGTYLPIQLSETVVL